MVLTALLLWGCSGGDSAPVIRSGEQFNQMAKEAEVTSREPLTRAERGEPLTEEDKTALRKSRLLYTGMRDFNPELPQAHFALAKIARAMDDDEEALANFNQVIQILAPKNPRPIPESLLLAEAYGEISRMMVLRGQFEDAGNAADLAHELAPADPRFRVDQASVLIQTKREKEALALLNSILESHPEDTRALSLKKLLAP